MRILFVALLAIFLCACESNPPAPVIDRLPQSNKPAPPISKSKLPTTAANKDWRPDNHTVKKGDTLFSIGLEYGYDYKEIAATNNIAPPYPIQIGQKLNLASLKPKIAAPEAKSSSEHEDGVVVTPIKTEPAPNGTSSQNKPTNENKPITSVVTPDLTEPKAIREPYSLEVMNRSAAKQPVKPAPSDNKPAEAKPIETKPTEAKPAETKPNDVKPTDIKSGEAKPNDDENLNWAWPTKGNVAASFNEVSNKGIDIAGATGQNINAAASGKIIYAGSDLRGYGKLVIIKHNKTYLSVYAHNSKIIAKEGQTVTAGQKIAEMGNTDTNTVKLHFEIRRLGKSVDPAKYLP